MKRNDFFRLNLWCANLMPPRFPVAAHHARAASQSTASLQSHEPSLNAEGMYFVAHFVALYGRKAAIMLPPIARCFADHFHWSRIPSIIWEECYEAANVYLPISHATIFCHLMFQSYWPERCSRSARTVPNLSVGRRNRQSTVRDLMDDGQRPNRNRRLQLAGQFIVCLHVGSRSILD
jgi:hypothetical protein